MEDKIKCYNDIRYEVMSGDEPLQIHEVLESKITVHIENTGSFNIFADFFS